ncbi:MAG: HAD family hydrolase [Chloroflexota bacterium]
MKFSNIQAFFFDLDGTLRIPTPSPVDAFIEIAKTLNIPISDKIERKVKLWAFEFWAQDKRIKEEMDRLGMAQFWIYYSGLLLDQVAPAENSLERAKYISNWFQNEYKPHDQLESTCLNTLFYLKEQGYLLGLISNRESPLDKAVEQLGLDGIFDFTLAAGEIGIWKPNPTIFWHVLSFFPHLSPNQCVYVGDNYFADSIGAQTAGLLPITFDPEFIYDSIDSIRIQKLEEIIPLTIGKIPENW